MAKYMRNGVQGLLLVLSFVLVVYFASLGCAYGKSINFDNGSNVMAEGRKINIPPCQKNTHKDLEHQFCCKLDNLCWSNLGECFTNCPCKINCQPIPTPH
uniref:Uncharacterized protein n=1 Tax=Avena sativa TaxID=4498 RepID=A0ACD5VMZ2_AVESA